MRKINFWLAGLLLLMVGTVLWGKSAAIICWDGIDVDEDLLDELCGISREEYFSADFDPESCPEAEQAVRMIGGCETDWGIVVILAMLVSLVYLVVSGIILVIVRWRRKTKLKQEAQNS